MVFIAYAIIWIAILIFTGWLYVQVGSLNVLWLLLIPMLMSPQSKKDDNQ